MESTRFDDIARRFARTTSRRGVIVAIVAAGAAGISSAGQAVGASRVCRAAGASCTARTRCCNGACPTGKAVPRAQRNRCPCEVGASWCTSSCQSMNQPAHCGGCNQACPAGWTCPTGECCLANGDQCSADTDCCIGSCDADSGVCCISAGEACTVDGDCCSGNCAAGTGVCCISTGSACTADAECCSGICDAFTGTCIATLLAIGAPCSSGEDCLSTMCGSGVCCAGSTVTATNASECCSGTATPGYLSVICD